MSTHNMGFYEDFTKIIFELSSNIIKYAPYFFCCCYLLASNHCPWANLHEAVYQYLVPILLPLRKLALLESGEKARKVSTAGKE